MIISSSFIKMTTISRLIIIHNFQFFEKQNKKIGKYARSPWPVSEFYRVFNELLQILKELFQSLNEFFQVLNEPIWKFLHDLFQILTRSSPFLFLIFLIIQKWGNEVRKRVICSIFFCKSASCPYFTFYVYFYLVLTTLDELWRLTVHA